MIAGSLNLRAYRAIFSARFRMLLQYRVAAFAGLATQIFFGLLRIMILGAFYAMPHAAAAPMNWDQVLTYIWLGQATLMILPTWTDGEVRSMILSGAIVYELAKPLDLYTLWFARNLASRTAPMLLRAIPMLAIAALFFGLKAPASPAAGAMWLLSTISAVLLSSAIGSLIFISILWTLSARGISDLTSALVWALSGILIPLPLFPEWMQSVIRFLPFRGLMDIPFRVYTGNIPPSDCAAAIGSQLLWTLVLVLIGKWLLAFSTRRIVVQGG